MDPSNVPSYLEWRDGLETRLATGGAKQRRVAELYTFLGAAYDSQDFPEVYANGKNVDEYVKHAVNFATEVKKDRGKFDNYLSEIQSLESDLKAGQDDDIKAAEKFNVSLKGQLELHGGGQFSKQEEYLRLTGEAQALMLDKQVMYIETVDAKAKEFIDGWQQVRKNNDRDTVGSIVLNAVDILTQVGIGGNGVFHLMTRDVSKMTFARKWWDVGTHGGDVGDFASVALSTYMVYDNLNSRNVPLNSRDASDWVTNRVNEMTGESGNFQALVSEVKDYTRDKAQDWLDHDGWRADGFRSRNRGHQKDKGWHNAVQNNPWLSVNEKQHLMMLDHREYNSKSLKGGYYDYNVDVLDSERAEHVAWQAHALFEWRKSDMVSNPPLTDQHWKDWVHWNRAIPAEEKDKLANLPTEEWQRLWNDQNAFLEYGKEDLYRY